MTDPAHVRERSARHLRRDRNAVSVAAIGLAGVMLSAIVTWETGGGDRGRPAPAAPAPSRSATAATVDDVRPPVIVDLEACSPFFSFSGTEHLEFQNSGVVETEDAAGAQPSDDPQVEGRKGTLAVDDATRRVRITIGRSTREYTLVVPADGDQCVLAAGPAHAADLQQSWFGEIGDEPEATPAPGPHVSLRSAHMVRQAPATAAPEPQRS